MKKIITILTLFCLSAISFAQNVNIPDANFKAYLVGNTSINTNGDSEIQFKEAEAFSGSMTVYYNSISDLTGIETFINLTRLTCSNNELTSLDITKNTALTFLSCSSNQLTSLNVTGLTNLTYLNCEFNQLTSLDVSNLTNLLELECAENKITNLDVTQNTALTLLVCSTNQLTSLDITQNTLLKDFICSKNRLTNLDMTQNTSLIQLNCSHNQLSSLDVSKNTDLRDLYCYNNQLSTLNMTENTILLTLACNYNQLKNITFANINMLQDLSCANNLFTYLDVSLLTNLRVLHCFSNQLTNLDLSKNIKLNNLHVTNNYLTNLNVSHSKSEYLYVDCRSNLLTSICVATIHNTSSWRKDNEAIWSTTCEINQNVNIPDANFKAALVTNTSINTNNDAEISIAETQAFTGTIDVSSKQITDLTGIEAFVNIIGLDCNDNSLTSLDVSKNISLEELDCSSNQLTSLDVWDLKSLYFLDAGDNAIKRIVISEESTAGRQSRTNSGGHQLRELYVSNNQLESLDLTSVPNLQTVDCSNNPLLNTIFVNSISVANTTPDFVKDASADWKEKTILAFSETESTEKAEVLKAHNLHGQEVPVNTTGEVIILLYDNGVREKTYVAE